MEDKLKKMKLEELETLKLSIQSEIDERNKQAEIEKIQWEKEHEDEINISWILLERSNGRWPDYEDRFVIYNLFSQKTIYLGGLPSHFGFDVIEMYNQNGQLMEKEQILELYHNLKSYQLKYNQICDLFRNMYGLKRKIR